MWATAFLSGSALIACLPTWSGDRVPLDTTLLLNSFILSLGTFFAPIISYVQTGVLFYPKLMVLGAVFVVIAIVTFSRLVISRLKTVPKDYVLDELGPADRKQFLNLILDDIVMPYEGSLSSNAANRRFDTLLRIVDREIVRTIRVRNRSEVIGFLTVQTNTTGSQKEFSILIRPSSWWKDSVSRASHEVLQEAFASHPRRKIVAEATKSDIEKLRFLKRIGFDQEEQFQRKGNFMVKFSLTNRGLKKHVASEYFKKIVLGVEPE